MNTPLYEKLYEAVAKTLEGMAFMEVNQHEDEDIESPTHDMILAHINFFEPVQGEIIFAVGEGLAHDIVESILCPSEPLTETVLFDALGELLNTVTGAFINGVFPDKESIKLSLPKLKKGTLEQNAGTQKLFCFESNEQSIFIILKGDAILTVYD